MCTQRWGHKPNIALDQAAHNLCAQEGLQLPRQQPSLQQVRLIYSEDVFPDHAQNIWFKVRIEMKPKYYYTIRAEVSRRMPNTISVFVWDCFYLPWINSSGWRVSRVLTKLSDMTKVWFDFLCSDNDKDLLTGILLPSGSIVSLHKCLSLRSCLLILAIALMAPEFTMDNPVSGPENVYCRVEL